MLAIVRVMTSCQARPGRVEGSRTQAWLTPPGTAPCLPENKCVSYHPGYDLEIVLGRVEGSRAQAQLTPPGTQYIAFKDE